MRKSRLSRHKQDRLIEHFVAGTTARCAAALIGVNRKTSAYYFHRLREIIADHLEREADRIVGGEIEVDESYFGGRRKGKRGRGASGKVPVGTNRTAFHFVAGTTARCAAALIGVVFLREKREIEVDEAAGSIRRSFRMPARIP